VQQRVGAKGEAHLARHAQLQERGLLVLHLEALEKLQRQRTALIEKRAAVAQEMAEVNERKRLGRDRQKRLLALEQRGLGRVRHQVANEPVAHARK
jgi:hypothetical protein